MKQINLLCTRFSCDQLTLDNHKALYLQTLFCYVPTHLELERTFLSIILGVPRLKCLQPGHVRSLPQDIGNTTARWSREQTPTFLLCSVFWTLYYHSYNTIPWVSFKDGFIMSWHEIASDCNISFTINNEDTTTRDLCWSA